MDFDITTETITPIKQSTLTIGGVAGVNTPNGTTAERPGTPVNGVIRYNTDGANFEGFENGSWITFSGINNVNSALYRSLTNNQAATDPGSGRIKWNNVTQISSTQLYMSSITDSGVDITQFLLKVAIGSILWIQVSNASTRYQRWQLDTITNNTGWFTFGVTLLDSLNAQYNNNTALVVAITSTGTGVVNSFSGGTTGLTPNTPTTGNVTLAGTLNAVNGGTGQTVYVVGDILTASSTTALTRLAGIATGNALISGGVGVQPSWGKIGLTTHVSGTLPIANGGTGLTTTPTNGQIDIGNGTGFTRTTLTAGTGVSVTNGVGSITLANTGVTSLAGTANQIAVSAATGAITLSTPSAFIAPGSVQVTTTLLETTSAALTAAGATQGTATALPSRYNIVTTVAAGTGVILPSPVTPFGNQVYVANRGANPLNIYPNTSAAIVNGAVNAAVVLPVGQEASFVCTSATQWWTTESILTAGTNITLTPGAGTLTIASTGGGGTPAAPTNSVQWNNAGVFGGSASFLFTPGANPFATIQGTAATNQLRIGPAFTAPGLPAQYAAGGTSTVYIETNAANQDGQLVYFNNGAADISGYIGYAYDVNTPYIRITDADDDPPYIQFSTIGTGTYSQPLYASFFGARGTYGSRTLGANTGFEWKLGSGATAVDWGAATSVMMMDSQFLTVPGGSFNGAAATGTTANRPAAPVAGMVRFNNDFATVEEFGGGAWSQSVGVVARSTTSTVTAAAGPTNILSYSVPGGLLGTNRLLRINLNGLWNNASGAARTVTVAVSYGGTTLWQDISASVATGATLPWNMDFVLSANNATNSQRLGGLVALGSTGAATTGNGDLSTDEITGLTPVRGTAAVDSTTAQTLNVAITFSGATNNWTTDYYTIEAM